MGVVIAPSELHVDPVLVSCAAVVLISLLMQQAGLGNLPLEGGEQQNISATRIHLVGLARMDGFLLDAFDLERVEFHVEDLAQIHHNGLVDLLPQVSSEDLDQGDLQSWNLSVHEDPSQIELHLETDVHIGSVDGW